MIIDFILHLNLKDEFHKNKITKGNKILAHSLDSGGRYKKIIPLGE